MNFSAICVNGELVDRGKTYPVNVYYWWPGREVTSGDDWPKEFLSLARRAKKSKSTYAVCAIVDLPGARVHTTSRCMSIDRERTTKKYGRLKALGRLRQVLLSIGYDLVESW